MQLKPWLQLYTPGLPATFAPSPRDGLSLFREAVARAPDKPAVLYFDGRLTYAELDAMSYALAAALVERGFVEGDRLAIYMQNMPQFLIAVLAAWKARGIAVPVNPMNRQRELTLILADSEPRALVCLDTLFSEVVEGLPGDVVRPPIVITTSGLDLQSRCDPRLFAHAGRQAAKAGAEDLLALIESCRGRDPPRAANPKPEDIAFLVYTSGTTGVPKAAMNTHANVAFAAQSISRWYSLKDGDAILALAPLFHVTGLVVTCRDVLASRRAADPGLSLRAGRRARRAGRAQAGASPSAPSPPSSR